MALSDFPAASLAVRLSEAWRRFAGWPALAALLLAILAFAIRGAWIPAIERDTKALAAEHAARALAEQTRRAIPSSIETATAFFSALPKRSAHLDDQRSLYAQASENRLTIQKAEYSFDSESGANLVRMKAIVPISGSYQQLRQFLAQLLNTHQHLALETIQMERPEATQDMLQTRLHLSYTYRAE
jgi:hypothetical protein